MSRLREPDLWDIMLAWQGTLDQGPAVPYELRLEPWVSQGWKVKIFDLEGPEHPHVTIYRRATSRWRLNLRSGRLLDRAPAARDLPPGLLDDVVARLELLRVEWDRLHPENPVGSRGQDEG